MTTSQLKRHMDSRLRTKADKADLKAFEARLVSRLDALDARFDGLDRRFNSVEAHGSATDSRLSNIEAHVSRTDSRLSTIEAHVGTIREIIQRNYDQHELVLDEHENRLRDLERLHL